MSKIALEKKLIRNSHLVVILMKKQSYFADEIIEITKFNGHYSTYLFLFLFNLESKLKRNTEFGDSDRHIGNSSKTIVGHVCYLH
jgi:hypothetical protein